VTVIIIQARTGSSRLPGKILMQAAGKTILERMIERVSAAKIADGIVVATTIRSEDDKIVSICEHNNYLYYRGHPTDLLDRHYKTAKEYGAKVVVKIPSDCPLIDPKIIDKVISYFHEHADKYDYVSNLHPPSYPDGNDVEVMTMDALRAAWFEAEKDYEREHTTPYIWEHPERFSIGNVVWESGYDYSMSHRFTLDYREDLEFIRRIYTELYTNECPIFSLDDIIQLLHNKPDIYEINNKYRGVNWYRNHINDLKTIDKTWTVFNS
jgi:spore coat polysaccharide biosynthesis protein SpsF